jgi:hypothetical protein
MALCGCEFCESRCNNASISCKGVNEIIRSFYISVPLPVCFNADDVHKHSLSDYEFREKRSSGSPDFLRGAIAFRSLI